MPFVHGKPSHQTGFKHTSEAKERMRISKIGERNPQWKGDNCRKETARERAQRLFPNIPEGYERHHIDGNVHNNSLGNIAIVTRKEHMTLDGRLLQLRNAENTAKRLGALKLVDRAIYGLDWMIYAKVEYQKGVGMKEIARSIGCSKALVSTWLLKLGKPKNKRGWHNEISMS